MDFITEITIFLALPLIVRQRKGIEEVIGRLDTYYLEETPEFISILSLEVFPVDRARLEFADVDSAAALTSEDKSMNHPRSVVTGVKFGVAGRIAAIDSCFIEIPEGENDAGAQAMDWTPS